MQTGTPRAVLDGAGSSLRPARAPIAELASDGLPDFIDEPRSGYFRARVRRVGADGLPRRITVACGFDLGAVIAALALFEQSGGTAGAMTLGEWGATWLGYRERAGVRNSQGDVDRWRLHVAPSALACLALVEIRPRHVRAFVRELGARLAADRYPGARAPRVIGVQTRRNILYLVRAALRDAVHEGLVETNPSLGVTVPTAPAVEEPWTFLQEEEIRAVGDVMARRGADGARFAAIVAWAIGTGKREGEIRSLRWEHVTWRDGVPVRVAVREGSPGRTTKSGKVRHLPLLPLAQDALLRWVEVGGTNPKAPSSPVFPTAKGAFSAKGALVKRDTLARVFARAGIARRVRFHDLRHTCAAALVSGWWGRAWSLEEVKLFLGHGSIAMTERYAHLAEGVLDRAARETVDAAAGLEEGRSRIMGHGGSQKKPGIAKAAPPARFERAANGLGSLEPVASGVARGRKGGA